MTTTEEMKAADGMTTGDQMNAPGMTTETANEPVMMMTITVKIIVMTTVTATVPVIMMTVQKLTGEANAAAGLAILKDIGKLLKEDGRTTDHQAGVMAATVCAAVTMMTITVAWKVIAEETARKDADGMAIHAGMPWLLKKDGTADDKLLSFPTKKTRSMAGFFAFAVFDLFLNFIYKVSS